MNFDVNITDTIDGFLSEDVLQILNWVGVTIGIGLIIWGLVSHKKEAENEQKWNKVVIVIGILMSIRALLSLFGIW